MRAGIVEPACGVSPFSMTKSPPGQAKPGVENRKKRFSFLYRRLTNKPLPALHQNRKRAPLLSRGSKSAKEEQQADGIKGACSSPFFFRRGEIYY